MRLTNQQKEKLRKEQGVDRIWSFSMINSFHNCPWEYKMKYIDHERVNNDNAYTIFGTECHDTIQGYYDGTFTYDDMRKEWDRFVNKWENDPAGLRFDTDKIKAGYLNNISHYFSHTDVTDKQGHNELPVVTKLTTNQEQKLVFVGYIDSCFKGKDGSFTLVDYKSSSKSSFSKSKLPEKSMQLMLYAMGIHQQYNIPLDKINCKFDMMKYCTVHFKQENGKWKESVQERSKWVAKMNKKLETKLKKLGYDDTTAMLDISQAAANNNMDNLPKEISEQFYITNYLIELPVNEETMQQAMDSIIERCQEILEFEQIDDLESYLEVHFPYNPDDYYCKKLCAYHSTNKFKEENGMLRDMETEVDLDKMLGIDNTDSKSESVSDDTNSDEYDSDEDILEKLFG